VFTQLLLSLFGIVVVHRILSLFEKDEVFEARKLRYAHIFLQIPLTFHLIFKDLTAFNTIYIGSFFVLLILSSKIIEFFRQKMFVKLHLSVLQQLILQISAGHSPNLSVKNVFNELSSAEKRVFAPLKLIFERSTTLSNEKLPPKSADERFFYEELALILNSGAQIREQLAGFRRLLSLQHNLRHRSRQTLAQSKAQALTCGVLYIIILALSVNYLGFEVRSFAFLVSVAMQLAGICTVFSLGRKISWKT
jgi:hypothetical protein